MHSWALGGTDQFGCEILQQSKSLLRIARFVRTSDAIFVVNLHGASKYLIDLLHVAKTFREGRMIDIDELIGSLFDVHAPGFIHGIGLQSSRMHASPAPWRADWSNGSLRILDAAHAVVAYVEVSFDLVVDVLRSQESQESHRSVLKMMEDADSILEMRNHADMLQRLDRCVGDVRDPTLGSIRPLHSVIQAVYAVEGIGSTTLSMKDPAEKARQVTP